MTPSDRRGIPARDRPGLYGLFARVNGLLPPAAWQTCTDLLGPDAGDRPITMT
ncbi:hypothetical protein [Streptomyces novaecaesareae]|uniref:hypothetical protein n=1 Tax=Streptomyces novaecaesareae TaxID=68244 RepID=UPI000A97A724|nr:hypothetical protein [Streptomyces novaecaesareae]